MNKHLIWATALVIIFMIISGTLIWINYNSWTIRFEMDENTKEAIESIEFDNNQNIYSDELVMGNVSNLKYKIEIDCNWISEHLDDDTISFPIQTFELCEEFFPELNYTSLEKGEQE